MCCGGVFRKGKESELIFRVEIGMRFVIEIVIRIDWLRF